MKSIISSLLLFISFTAHAVIYLDHEADPIPLVSIDVVFPQGEQAGSSEEIAAARLLSDILASGTMSKAKQEFNDALARFAAAYSFQSGVQYSYWTLEFPYLEDKSYDPLTELLRENWDNPRLTQGQFKISLDKLKSSISGQLNSDAAIVGGLSSDWFLAKELGFSTLFLDHLDNVKLESVSKFFNEKLKTTTNAWAGYVGPQSALPLVQKLLLKVFPAQGSVLQERLKTQLPPNYQARSTPKPSKKILLIDRKDRAQNVTSLNLLSSLKRNKDNEIVLFFGDYLLFSNGLDSYFGDIVRNEKGLAYSVGGVGTNLYGFISTGYRANPQSARQDEAIKTLGQITSDIFLSNNNLKIIDDESFRRVFQGFRNLKAIENGLATQRLSNRMGVVTGANSYSFAVSDPSDWNVERDDIAELFGKVYSQSAALLSIVGNAEALDGKLRMAFPDYKIIQIPFKETLYSRVLKN